MAVSITQWFWHECLGMDDWLPPEPKSKKKERFGPDQDCWLCGGPTHGKGWPLKDGIPPTFTDFNQAKAPWSLTACGACVAMSSSAAYGQYAEREGKPLTFPVKEGKKPRALNWLYFSHVVSPTEYHQPDRKQWRDLLLEPPEPPFLMAMAVNGKKHVIFRGMANNSRDQYVVQADEERIHVDRAQFAEMLAQFEEAYNAGFSKDSLLTGQYNQAAIMSAGLSVWRRVEEQMSYWRQHHPGLLQLAHFVGQKKDSENI